MAGQDFEVGPRELGGSDSVRAAVTKLADGYTAEQLATIGHFVTHVAGILRDQTARLNGDHRA